MDAGALANPGGAGCGLRSHCGRHAADGPVGEALRPLLSCSMLSALVCPLIALGGGRTVDRSPRRPRAPPDRRQADTLCPRAGAAPTEPAIWRRLGAPVEATRSRGRSVAGVA